MRSPMSVKLWGWKGGMERYKLEQVYKMEK